MLNLWLREPIDSRCKGLDVCKGEDRCDLAGECVAPLDQGDEHLEDSGDIMLLWSSMAMWGGRPSWPSRVGYRVPLDDGEEKEKFSNIMMDYECLAGIARVEEGDSKYMPRGQEATLFAFASVQDSRGGGDVTCGHKS